MEEKKVQLEQFCAVKRIQKFAPEEMVELLEDGEAVDWIVGQALPEGPEEEVRELTALLAQIAAQVAPVAPAQEEVDTPAVAETEVPPGEEPLDWEELENLPLPPGVDLAQVKRLLDSPQGEMLADFSLFCQERGVSPEGGGEDMEKVLHDLHEEWLQTPRASLGGRKPAEVLEGGRLLPHKVETFRREGPKIGRNDPCPCGSGKKYKKCCGKAA